MRVAWIGLAAVVAVIGLGVAGCGSDSEQTTVTETVSSDASDANGAESTDTTEAESDLVPVEVLSPAGVEKCLERGDATVLSSESLNPGEPIDAHGVFAITGDSGARVGIVLTLKPFITKRLSQELAEEGSYNISVTPSDEAVVVFDNKATAEDEALASECAEP